MLDLDETTRRALWQRFLARDEARRGALRERPVAGSTDRAPGGGPMDATTALDEVMSALDDGIVPTDHPRYFGLFNSAPSALGALADAIVAAYNPQLATRGHATFPVASEERVIADLGELFGWARAESGGTFTSGGGEANLTALFCALHERFPECRARGMAALPAPACVYVSAEAHATTKRAARVVGLGEEAVRIVPVDAHHRMKVGALAEAIASDRREGRVPLFVVATCGTTSAGAIDPLADIARVAERADAWLHVDAAWGGLAAFVPELRPRIAGIERAHSITFDPHKVLSAPMGTGTLLTRCGPALERAFADATGYMPRDGQRDPYSRSLIWSRRFLGLRVLLPLMVHGLSGYAASLRRQVALAEELRERLTAARWRIVNDTPLPIVCFDDEAQSGGRFLDAVARHVIASGGGWLSVPRFANGGRALRACVNNHRSDERDIERFVGALEKARREVPP